MEASVALKELGTNLNKGSWNMCMVRVHTHPILERVRKEQEAEPDNSTITTAAALATLQHRTRSIHHLGLLPSCCLGKALLFVRA